MYKVGGISANLVHPEWNLEGTENGTSYCLRFKYDRAKDNGKTSGPRLLAYDNIALFYE